jgi:hypothetical protein
MQRLTIIGKRLDEHPTIWSAEVSSLVWKIIEIVGESNESFAKAVSNAVDEAGKTVKQMQWFEATQFRGTVKDGKVSQFQVVVKIGFKVER